MAWDCQWCDGRPGGCIICNAKPIRSQEQPVLRIPVTEDYPASAWDTSTDYGPRETAQAARDEAVDRVTQAADPLWLSHAQRAIRDLAAVREEFTTDAVWAILERREIAEPREPRAMAGAIASAKSGGLIEPTERFAPSDDRTSHARPKRVWRSLIYMEAEAHGKSPVPERP